MLSSYAFTQVLLGFLPIRNYKCIMKEIYNMNKEHVYRYYSVLLWPLVHSGSRSSHSTSLQEGSQNYTHLEITGLNIVAYLQIPRTVLKGKGTDLQQTCRDPYP